MRWWTGLLPYFLVRAYSIRFAPRHLHDGLIYTQTIGEEWICRKEAKP